MPSRCTNCPAYCHVNDGILNNFPSDFRRRVVQWIQFVSLIHIWITAIYLLTRDTGFMLTKARTRRNEQSGSLFCSGSCSDIDCVLTAGLRSRRFVLTLILSRKPPLEPPLTSVLTLVYADRLQGVNSLVFLPFSVAISAKSTSNLFVSDVRIRVQLTSRSMSGTLHDNRVRNTFG